MENKRDQMVKELTKALEEKKQKLTAEKLSSDYTTNCSFSYNKDGTRINLHTVGFIEQIVEMAAFLIEKKSAFAQANLELGTNCEFKWMGFTYENWISDLKTRAAALNHTIKKRELSDLENRLKGLMSDELKAVIELEEIANILDK